MVHALPALLRLIALGVLLTSPGRAELSPREAKVLSLDFDKRGKRLAAVRGDQRVQVFDTKDGTVLWEASPRLTSNSGTSHARVLWNADGRYLVLANEQMAATVFDGSTGKRLGVLGGMHVTDISVHPTDPRRVVVGRGEPEVEVWDLVARTLLKVHKFKKPKVGVERLVYHLKGAELLAWGSGSYTKGRPGGSLGAHWEDAKKFPSVKLYNWNGHGLRQGTLLTEKGAWSTLQGMNRSQLQETLLGNPDPSLAVSQLRKIGFQTMGYTCKIRALPSGKEFTPVKQDAPTSSLAIDSSGTSLAVGSITGEVHLYRVLKPDRPKYRWGTRDLIHSATAVATRWVYKTSSAETLAGIPTKGFEGFMMNSLRHRYGVFVGADGKRHLGFLRKGSGKLIQRAAAPGIEVHTKNPRTEASLPGEDPHDTLYYQGPISQFRPLGFGLLVDPKAKEARFGFFKNGKLHGRGALLRRRWRKFQSKQFGLRWESAFVEELYEGQWRDGELLEGSYWLDKGAFDVRDWQHVSEYEGQFRNLQAHGEGEGQAGTHQVSGTFAEDKLIDGKKVDYYGGTHRVQGGKSRATTVNYMTVRKGDIILVNGKPRTVVSKSSYGNSSSIQLADGSKVPGSATYQVPGPQVDVSAARRAYAAHQARKAAQYAAPSTSDTLSRGSWGGSSRRGGIVGAARDQARRLEAQAAAKEARRRQLESMRRSMPAAFGR